MGQFIPSTRQSMIDNHGVDPWASGNDAIEGAAILLSEGTLGLEGYNPGYPDSGDNQGTPGTWDGYLNEDVGKPTKGGNNKAAMKKWEDLVEQGKKAGIYDVPDAPNKKNAPDTMWRLPNTTKMKRGKMVAAGADPYTDGTDKDVIRLGEAMSRWVGQPLEISSANRPDQGYDSDHLYGSALDVPVLAMSEGGTAESEAYGDRVAAAAVMAAGGTKEQAAAIQQGIDQTVTSPNGSRVQILWKTSTGGNHFNHVHVGVAPDSVTSSPFKDMSQPMSVMGIEKANRAMNRLLSGGDAAAGGTGGGGGGVSPGGGIVSQDTMANGTGFLNLSDYGSFTDFGTAVDTVAPDDPSEIAAVSANVMAEVDEIVGAARRTLLNLGA